MFIYCPSYLLNMKNKKKTIRQKILDIMADGETHYYRDIARQLNTQPTSVGPFLCDLKDKGVIERAFIMVKEYKAGFFKLKSNE